MSKHFLSSIQWMVFILAGTIVTPISVAFAFHLSGAETAELLQRTFFIVGITSLLQGIFGHRLPLMEGPAGLWWAVFLTYASLAQQQGISYHSMLRSLESGLLASGALFILLSAFNLIKYVRKVFTPTMTGVYLLLLVTQLSGPFIEGILGVGNGHFNNKIAVGALITLALAIALSRMKIPFLRNYSVLISLFFGWVLFSIMGAAEAPVKTDHFFQMPAIFAWGLPDFQLSIFITAMLTSFLLLTNLLASIDVVKQVVKSDNEPSLGRTGFIMGINQLAAGLFSTIGGVPISGSAGFIKTTRITERFPFLAGSLLILLLSFFPVVMNILASIPAAVGYATLFVSIASIAGLGIQTLRPVLKDENKLMVISMSFMAGAGVLLLSPGALDGLPAIISSLISNGLVIGVLFGIILEQWVLRAGKKQDV